MVADGSLSGREVFGPSKLGPGGFIDGIAFDAFGNLWGTLIMADIVFAITPDGEYLEILNDCDEAATARLEAKFRADEVTADDMLATSGTIAHRGSPASPSAGPASGPAISAACAAPGSPTSKARSPACPWCIGRSRRKTAQGLGNTITVRSL